MSFVLSPVPTKPLKDMNDLERKVFESDLAAHKETPVERYLQEKLEKICQALNCSKRQRIKDGKIVGSRGHIELADNGNILVVAASNVALRLDRLPTPDEAPMIRQLIGIAKSTENTPLRLANCKIMAMKSMMNRKRRKDQLQAGSDMNCNAIR